MNFFYIFSIALALAMDAFAVSIGISLSQKKLMVHQTLRLAFSFGLFQFLMPILGWLAGKSILVYIHTVDHWIAFFLLGFIGAKMIYESFSETEFKRGSKTDSTRGLPLLVLSIATSIDALAVGLSFAVLSVSVIPASIIIGLVAFVMSVIGVKIAPVLGKIVGKGAELAGGMVLIAIGIKILVDHMG